MISWHPENERWALARNWRTSSLTDLVRISRGIQKFAWSPIIWRDGTRKEDNFLECRYGVLDFDDGALSVAQAIKNFCDINHIIGTTRHHGREKDGKPACDRFRLLFEFPEPIRDKRTYRWQMKRMVEIFDSDRACVDAARFFWPCREILSVVTDGDQFDLFPVPEDFENPNVIAARSRQQEILWREQRSLGRHVDRFLRDGTPFGEGRNQSCYVSALAMRKLGISQSEALSLIEAAPFARDDFTEKELRAAVISAYRKP